MAAAARRVNWLAIWITIGVVVVVVVVGALVVWMNRQALELAESPASAVVNEETGAIVLGEGPNVLEEYIDYSCPHCGSYHSAYGETVAGLVAEGEVQLELHPISILDSATNDDFSTRAAAATYCVAEGDPDAVYPFLDALFDAQSTSGMSDEQLVETAERAGANGAAECIEAGTYHDYVIARTSETPVAPGASSISTPTVILNGEFVSLTMDPEADIVSQLQ